MTEQAYCFADMRDVIVSGTHGPAPARLQELVDAGAGRQHPGTRGLADDNIVPFPSKRWIT